ncbi:AraC family transcriptional regulator [Lysobacter sp. CA199]|uniref:AraC family transcriptional regulator n=1 Tax=Lysobacter sp. CA199 TaxID=3455608 RepID=UPI003F8D72FF
MRSTTPPPTRAADATADRSRPRAPLRNSLPAAYLRKMLELAAERGVDPAELLVGSRLTLELLDNPNLRVMARDAAYVMRRTVELSGDEGLGMEFGLRTIPNAHGYLGYAAMSCMTLRDSLSLVMNYIHLRERDVSLHLFEQGEIAVLEARDTHDLGPWRQLIHESILIGLTRMSGFMLGEAQPEFELWFDWPEPAYYPRFRSRIPPVRYSMPANQLRLPRAYLDRRLITADQAAARQATEHIQREAASANLSEVNLLERVRSELGRADNGYPGLEQVASHLFMSGRTLKRKLGEHGVGFQELLDEVRERDAMRMLADPDTDIQAIAAALGYQDPPSFTRAFRRWTGTTPSLARQRLMSCD